VTANDDDIARITRRVSARGLSIHEISEVVGSQLKKQRHDIVEHMERRIKLVEMNRPHDPRVDALHRRITKLEADIRALARKGLLR
jgi:DNA-binding transcriptional MerR regulator